MVTQSEEMVATLTGLELFYSPRCDSGVQIWKVITILG